eukprot:TRINITY_DN26780_c0_g1_i1.p1 TRINITY_DN26780_c0_g1~~TRINITY_DN26780_c0_g1_i1.p1  ORF type:complete len:318 (-),score=62.35 TRINITY_DN26780_c0_g1_i1:239-1192(-)
MSVKSSTKGAPKKRRFVELENDESSEAPPSFDFPGFEKDLLAHASSHDVPECERIARMLLRYAKFQVVALSHLLKKTSSCSPNSSPAPDGSSEIAKRILKANSEAFKELILSEPQATRNRRQGLFTEWLAAWPKGEAAVVGVEASLRRQANQAWRHARDYVVKKFWERLEKYFASPGPARFLIRNRERLDAELGRAAQATREVYLSFKGQPPTDDMCEWLVPYTMHYLHSWTDFPTDEFLERQRAAELKRAGSAVSFRKHPPRPSIQQVRNNGCAGHDEADSDSDADGDEAAEVAGTVGASRAPSSAGDFDLDALLR